MPNFLYEKIFRPIIFTSRLGRRALLGQAGSGTFADYIYRNHSSGYSKFGHIVDKILLSLPASKATKSKMERISDILGEEIDKNLLKSKMSRIVDLGSGPARYLTELLRDEDKSDVKVT